MAEIDETQLCIVCNNPASSLYSSFDHRLPSTKLSTSGRLKLKKKVESCPEDPSEDNETDVLLLPQLRVVFLLKHIFQQSLHNHDIIETMRTLGNPSEWFEICQKCTELVDEGVEVLRKLKLFEEKRKQIVSTLKGRHASSISYSNVGKYFSTQDKTLCSKSKLDFRKRVREIDDRNSYPVDVKLEVEPEMLSPEHHDDWSNNDNLELPIDCNESQPSFKQIKISEGSMEKFPLDIKDVSRDYVKKVKRVWSKYKEDPDYVWKSAPGRKTGRKCRKSDRGASQLTVKDLANDQHKDPEVSDNDNEALSMVLPENPEVEEEETLEILKKNRKLRQKILKVRSSNLQGRWRRKLIKNNVKNVKLKRAKATLQKSSKLEEIENDDESDADQINTSSSTRRPGRPQLETSKFILERAHEHLDMSLVPYPPRTTADMDNIPIGGKCARQQEEGACSLETDFPCPKCGKYFGNKFYAIAHIHRVHLEIERPWRSQCINVYTDCRHLKFHMKNHNLLSTCPICKISYSKNKMLNDVLNHEKGKDTPKCHVCSKTFSHFNIYIKHMTEHGFYYSKSNNSKYVCELCSATFKLNKELDYHKIKLHNEVDQDGRFPICTECSEVLFDNRRLEKHAVKVHGKGSMNFFCEHCGKGFFEESDLKLHLSYCGDSKGKICQICGDGSKNEKLLKRHILRLHPETINMSMEEIDEYIKKKKGETPFQCKLCPQAFSFQNLLYHHHRKDHPEVTDKFKCSECGKGFSRQCSVKRHYENYHLKLEYKCERCGKAFSKDGLTQHQRFHCKVKQQTQSDGFNDTPSSIPIPSLGQPPVTIKTVDVEHGVNNFVGFEQFNYS